MNSPDLIRKFQDALPTVRAWVASTLAANQNRAVPVSRMDYPRIGKVFPPELLDRARVRVVRDKPPFPPLSRMGLAELASFEAMPIAGITYQNTFFVTHGQQSESLCFHEIVHVVQWDQLGIDHFLLAYGVGLMQFGYRNSPLEAMAFALQDGFDRGVLPGDLMGRIQRDSDAIWHDVSARFAMD
jgi:hypothetical protein